MPNVYRMTVTSSRQEGTAQKNEPVFFFPTVYCNETPLYHGVVRWELRRNLTELGGEGEISLENRVPFLRCSSPEAAYLKGVFRFVSEEGQELCQEIGVLVAPEELKPALEVPADFDAFWDRQRKRLASVPLHLNLRPLPTSGPEIEAFDLSADCVGMPVRGELLRPAERRGTLPAIIVPQGAGVRSAGVGTAQYWAARGFLALDINAHGIENGRDPSYYRELSEGALLDYPARGFDSGDPEKAYALGIFLRMKRAIEAVASLPEWDGRNLIVYGGSQGAWQAFAGAYLDSRVSTLAAWIPAGSDMFNGGWPCQGAMPCRSDLRAEYAKTLPYFDNCSFASRLRIPVGIIAGLIDNVCKADGVMAVYNSCPSEKKELSLHYQMGHETPENLRTALDAFVMRNLQQ